MTADDRNNAVANRRVLEMAVADGRWTWIDPIATMDEEKFNLVRIGTTRAHVERMLGPPKLTLGREVYGRVPRIELWQSPVAPRSISITYSSEDVVIDKKFYRDQTTRRPRR